MLASVGVIAIFNHVTQSLGPAISGSQYRLYETSNSINPGTPLAATSTAAQLSTQGQSFRLRTGLATRDNSIEATTIQAGYTTSCAVVSGIPYCSGRNINGEIGNNTRTSTTDFTPVDTSTGLAGKTISMFSVGALANNYVSVCAVADGLLYCWGNNQYGTLGVGQTVAQLADTTVPLQAIMDGSLTGQTITKIDGGSGHTCGMTAAGKGFCWGTGGNGRLGDGTGGSRTKPTEINMTGVLATKTITDIAAGSGHSCAIASAAVYCWGSGAVGALGNNSTADSSSAVAVSTAGVLVDKTMSKVALALNTSCALDTAGLAYCWGQNNATLGNNSGSGDSLIPVAVDMTLVPSGGFSSLSGRENNFCGIAAANGLPYCWGINSAGNTGRGVTNGSTTRPTPATSTGFLSGKTLTYISSGRGTTCGITNLAEAFCWGYNGLGNLGMNSATNPFTVATAVSTANFTPAQGTTIAANTLNSRLEFAAKTAGSCSAQTGFAPVTSTSAIAWSVNGSVSSGTAISATGNDPVSGSATILETYVSDSASFNNPQAITPGKTGLWDFSLRDNSGLFNQPYCLRLAQSNGTGYTAYTAYPQVTTAQGVLSVSIVDGSDAIVGAPSASFANVAIATTCQSASSTLGTSTQRIKVNNDTTNPSWSLNLAATGGATATWQHSTLAESYDYNDGSGSPAGCTSGLDGDGKAGQLTINPSSGSSTVTAKSGCSTTGVTKGTSQSFVQGSANAITLLNASVAASNYCYWTMTGIDMSQTVPAAQPGGTYTLDMTLTVLAQ